MKGLIYTIVASVSLLTGHSVKAEVVIEWIEFGREIESRDGTPNSLSRYFRQTHLALAIFEAANMIDRKYESKLGLEACNHNASVEVAIMTAAHDVLRYYYPDRKRDIENRYEAAMALVETGDRREKGISLGRNAAVAVLGTGRIDPMVSPYKSPISVGKWVPKTLPAYPDWYAFLPFWSIENPVRFMPPRPPSLTSEVWARDFEEVMTIGAKNSFTRTAAQSRMALERKSPRIIPMLRSIAAGPERSTVQNARMVALLYMAIDDTDNITGKAKLRYNFWRPNTAIRNADQDSNPRTTIDHDWKPLIETPNHPGYPCARCSWTTAVATILEKEVGNAPHGGVLISSRSLTHSLVQVQPTFDQWVAEVSYSRILAGVQYRFSNDAGEKIGRDVAGETLNLLAPISQTPDRSGAGEPSIVSRC